jgi:hypothetical protein
MHTKHLGLLTALFFSLWAAGPWPTAHAADFTYETTTNGTITITGYTGLGGPVTIPDTINGLPVTSIGSGAFAYCTSLTNVMIPNSVTSIGESAFYSCAGLISITIPNSVTSIGGRAFSWCTSLTIVTIPNSVISIGEGAFSGCTSLTTATIPDSVTSIGGGAFGGCSRLTSVTIGNSVTSIEGSAFSGCTSLTSVTIGNSVTNIGYYAFSECTSLTTITIPNSVISIRGAAFNNCSSLSAITVEALNSFYSSLDGVLFDKSQTTLIQCPGGKAGHYTIPNSVTSIGEGSFSGCGLTNVTIPDSVTNIGYYAFSECTSLTSVTIPDSVTNIGGNAFWSCTSLSAITVEALNSFYSSLDGVLFDKSQTTLIQCPRGKAGHYTIPNSVTSIGEGSFSGCGLTNVTIPNSVISIGGNAFWSCTSLTSVTLGNGVTSIGNGAFYNCSSLTNVTIGNGVTNIGGWAFHGSGQTEISTGLRTLTVNGSIMITEYDCSKDVIVIPDTINGLPVTNIGDGAFSDCTNLTSVTIPDSATSIGEDAFGSCTGLTSVTIGKNVTNIGERAFYACTSLTSITIPDSVTSIGGSAFSGCSSLTNVTIGSSVTYLTGFSGCTNLANVTIGSNVASIGAYAFYQCTGLTSVTIPTSVISIGERAFFDCTSLKGVYFNGDAPSGVGSKIFYYKRPPSMLDVTPLPVTVYFLAGTTGWGTRFAERPTALWVRPNPVILNGSVGIQTNQFGFTISWATNLSVVVEASTTLTNPTWSPVATNTLTSGSSYFSDSQWLNYPARFYRIRTP